MAWNPISGTFIQYGEDDVDASGFYLKFYASGTTAPISMADDSGGGTLLAKCALDPDGMPVNGSSAPFIPHVDQQYKIVIYRNSTDADSDTIANAYKVIDELYPSLSSVTEATSNVVYGTVALAKAATFTSGKLANTKGYTTSGDGGGADYLVKTTAAYGGTPNGFSDHATDDGDFVLVLQENGESNVLAWGATPHSVIADFDNTAIFQAMANDTNVNIINITSPRGIAKVTYKSGQLLAKATQSWIGQGIESTVIDFSLANAGEDGFLLTGGVSNFWHGGGLFNFKIEKAPRHGFYCDNTASGGVGEGFSMDLMQSNRNGGDGFNFSGDSTPIQLGRLSVHGNGGTGLRFKGEGQGFVQVIYLAGDNNVESLCTMEDISTETNIQIVGWKSERWSAEFTGHDNVFKLVNVLGGCVNIGPGRYTSQLATAPNAVVQVASGSSVYLTIGPIVPGSGLVTDYTYMLEDLVGGRNYTPAELKRKSYNSGGVVSGPAFSGGHTPLWTNGKNAIGGIPASNELRLNHTADGASTNTTIGAYNGSTKKMGLTNSGTLTLAGNVGIGSVTAPTYWITGTGTPEGSITASPGGLFSRTDGGASTTLYVKESGTGNTGWVAK